MYNLKFKNMTIRRKLTAIIMLTVVFALLSAMAAFIVCQYFDIKNEMITNLSMHASIIADNCRASVAFEDTKNARETLSALRAVPYIVYAGIDTPRVNGFAYYNRDPNDITVHVLDIRDNNYSFTENSLNLRKQIVLDGETIGTVYMKADLEIIRNAISRTAAIAVTIAAGVIIVAYLLSFRLQRIISGPILSLAEVAKIVSENKDYSMRAVSRTSDEIGRLIDAFNGMLGEIQQRDLMLTGMNEKLEGRVRQRTAELVTANRKLEQLNSELKQAVDKLTAANRDLADFAHVAAHDLKAPLRAIGSLAGMISQDYSGILDEQGKQYLDTLVKRTQRMSELINGILRYSEVGKSASQKEKLDLDKLVEEVIAGLVVPQNIHVTFENKLPVVFSEKTYMIQIFQNLINNAVKYIDKLQGYVKVGCAEEGDFWKFYVSDNGPGIEEKYFKKIFNIFQTLNRRDEVESTGIGLSVVKKIVELNGGSVWIESVVGQGSSFYFTLPKIRKRGYKKCKIPSQSF